MSDRLSTLWHLHHRLVIVGGAIFVGLLALLVATGLVIRFSGGTSNPQAARTEPAPVARSSAPARHTAGAASDVAFWDARPAITPAASERCPAIPVSRRADPGAYATAFAAELFTRSYNDVARDELLSWAQYENAPLRSPNYPEADWTKVLEDSLTDPTWDEATDTPVPPQGVWLALAHDHASTTVSALTARVDSQWEQRVSEGYEPTDQLMTVWDVTFRLTQTSDSGVHRYDVSLALQLGTSPRGMYGVAVTNNFVIREVS